MYQHILVTTDGSEQAQQGVNHGLTLARALGAQVSVLTVTPPFPTVAGMLGEGAYTPVSVLEEYDTAQQVQANSILSAATAQMPPALRFNTKHIRDAQPAEAIVRYAAEQGCDLICMASHGRRGLRRVFLGSQAAEVFAQSSVPVLIVR